MNSYQKELRRRTAWLISPLIIALSTCSEPPAPEKTAESLFTQMIVYKQGERGYHTYRIPALITTQKGTLLAFCEARTHSYSDTDDIDVVLRRSFDNGKTWTEFEMVAEHGEDTLGNPAPVVDRDTGTIWLLMTSNLVTTPFPKILTSSSAAPVSLVPLKLDAPKKI